MIKIKPTRVLVTEFSLTNSLGFPEQYEGWAIAILQDPNSVEVILIQTEVLDDEGKEKRPREFKLITSPTDFVTFFDGVEFI